MELFYGGVEKGMTMGEIPKPTCPPHLRAVCCCASCEKGIPALFHPTMYHCMIHGAMVSPANLCDDNPDLVRARAVPPS